MNRFRGGIHPYEAKHLTERAPLAKASVPQELIVPLSQHIGAPAGAVVKKKDKVKKGQVIGEAAGFVSVPIHAPVSGSVTAVEVRPGALGPVESVVIENDGNEEWVDGPLSEPDTGDIAPAEIRDRILAAGIVGMGGATFPTHVKLSPPADKPVETLILNGAECEPYLTADHRLMLECPREILDGARLVARVLDAKRTVVAIEANKPDAIRAMREAADGSGVEVVKLRVKYPQGAEKQLLKTVLGREVPSGGLPMDVAAVVHNVATAKAVCDAVRFKRPLVERAVTVSGDAVDSPANYWARIGTPIRVLLEESRVSEHAARIVLGGPMMGLAQFSVDVPVTRGTSGILAFREPAPEGFQSCIRCGLCVEACPAGLMPSVLSVLGEAERVEDSVRANVADCMECGCCTYVCPAKRPIVQFVKFLKAELKKQSRKPGKGAEA